MWKKIVDQAIRLKVPAIWMQEDVIHEKAAEKARTAGNLRGDGPLHSEGTSGTIPLNGVALAAATVEPNRLALRIPLSNTIF